MNSGLSGPSGSSRRPEAPGHGYELGDWTAEWDARAKGAAGGGWIANGERSYANRRGDVAPNTDVRKAEPDT